MNEDGKKFIEMLGIDLGSIDIEQQTILEPEDINVLTANYGVHSSRVTSLISIADIVGYEYRWRKSNPNLFESLSSFFDSKGDTYHSRSVKLLGFNSDTILSELERSFKQDPIVVEEMGDGKYVISTNGLHRYTVLRCHYLAEYSKASDENERKRIDKKYTIPVSLSKLDYKKTYSKYLLCSLKAVKDIWAEYDKDYNTTGRVIVIDKNGQEAIYDDEELINLVNRVIPDELEESDIGILSEYASVYPTFKEYLRENVPKVKISEKEV